MTTNTISIEDYLRISILCIMLGVFNNAWSQDTLPCEETAATLVSEQGSVRIDGEIAELNQAICSGSVVIVGVDSRAGIRLLGTDSLVRVDSNTEFVIKPSKPNSSIVELIKGIVYLFTRDPESFRVDTPYLNAAVDGTEFVVSANDEFTRITLIEGRLRASNDNGKIVLNDRGSAISGADETPVYRETLNPFSAVQWALFYPPIGVEEAATDSARRASALLGVGNKIEASRLLEIALKENPNDASALALQSIIVLVSGNKFDALRKAQQAVAIQKNSSVAHSALSYARQAVFQLTEALDSAQKAVNYAPSNAYTWARLAELQTAAGQLGNAQRSSKRAVALKPDHSRTYSVMGFIKLAKGEISDASEAFSRAIKNDSTDPLARLGAGLAKIRIGKLKKGREDIEVAAILDPNNSLVRSYLAKSYSSENRYQLASQQFDIASQLDPNDPTPWLYSAIQSQALNRPVEALEQLRESIKRNDNRSIYRSRFDLDSDLSSRQTRQGLIYNDLGFEQAALLEGWKSLSSNPTNFASHRLLADSYLDLPRHQFARDSELLQSQMLQPNNLTPVQPNLSVGDLSLASDTDQRKVGFNEFTRLFVEDELKILMNGTVGSNETSSGEVIVSGITESTSFSLASSHYETDGVRENNDSKQNTNNMFFQYTPRYDTSVQLEYRNSEKKEGDRQLLFDPEYIFPAIRTQTEKENIRLGLRHDISHTQTLLVAYFDVSGSSDILNFEDDTIDTNFKLNDDFKVFEARHILDMEKINLNSGISSTSGNTTQVGLLFSDDIPFGEFDVDHHLAYSYLDVEVLPNAVLTLGLSYTEFENSRAKYSKTSPKLGLLWNITPRTTLRSAYAGSAKRPFTLSQSLEPVSVAGFNQLFNDSDGTRPTRYGVGIDHWIHDRLSTGIEYSERALEVPVRLESPFADENESLGRAYAYWAPSKTLAISAEVTYETFDLDPDRQPSEQFSEMNLLKIPISLRYFNPNGLFTKIKSTYVEQDGRFDTNEGFDTPQEDSFTVFDWNLGYRLPHRIGVISVEVRNIFDTNFQFQNSGRQDIAQDFDSTLVSSRQFFLNIKLNY